MQETMETEMNMDVCGVAVITTRPVTEEGRDTVRGTVIIG